METDIATSLSRTAKCIRIYELTKVVLAGGDAPISLAVQNATTMEREFRTEIPREGKDPGYTSPVERT